jgi:hypothetical protein
MLGESLVKDIFIPAVPGGPRITLPKKRPPCRFQKDLEEAFVLLQTPDSFAVSESANSQTNPGLRVKNVGGIGLQLSTRDALEIVGSAYQAPFGTNGKNTIDVSIRNTWEIRADDVAITNPVWPKFLASIVSRAYTGLGVYPARKKNDPGEIT